MLRSPKALLCTLLAVCMIGVVSALDFSNSKYIWKNAPTGPNGAQRTGNATFRRDWTPPMGKVPVSANVLINADDVYTLFVNGGKVGSGNDIHTAQRYCVRLVNSCNTFAIEAQNVPDNTPAGVLTAIQIRYTDGFTDTIVSDTQWHATGNAPAGFEQVAFDDSTWPAAFNQGSYPATPGYAITLPPAPPSPNSGAGPSLPSANWIWTNEVRAGSAPTGGRAFRKRVNLPNGDLVNSAVISIVADNQYTLYVNGLVVGSGSDFANAQRFVVNFPPTSTVVIAVFAVNTGGPAGLLAAVELVSCDCSSNVYLVTDGSWKYSTSVPAGFPSLGFDDAAWSLAVVEGKYGIAPWGQTTIPTRNSPQSAPLPGAPAAAPASVVV